MELVLKEDWVIPKGTVFNIKDYTTTIYPEANAETILDMEDGTDAKIYIDADLIDSKFERR